MPLALTCTNLKLFQPRLCEGNIHFLYMSRRHCLITSGFIIMWRSGIGLNLWVISSRYPYLMVLGLLLYTSFPFSQGRLFNESKINGNLAINGPRQTCLFPQRAWEWHWSYIGIIICPLGIAQRWAKFIEYSLCPCKANNADPI